MLFAVVLALFGVGAEGALRLMGLGSPVLFAPDPAVGFIPAQNQTRTRFGSHIFVNHAGMRSSEFLDEKPAGTKRILFVGDSVTFGPTFVDQTSLFTTLISSDLGPWWDLLNASSPGWATGNELGFLRSRGTYQADIVVMVINTGDLDQPFATFDSAANSPIRQPPFALWELMVRYVFPGLFHLSHADPGSTGQTKNVIPLDEVIGNLAAARRVAEGAGARFVLVYEAFQGKTWEIPDRKKRKSALDAWAAANHVDYLDLTGVLAQVPQQQIYYDGEHLRAAGHRLVATEIERFLLSGERR